MRSFKPLLHQQLTDLPIQNNFYRLEVTVVVLIFQFWMFCEFTRSTAQTVPQKINFHNVVYKIRNDEKQLIRSHLTYRSLIWDRFIDSFVISYCNGFFEIQKVGTNYFLHSF